MSSKEEIFKRQILQLYNDGIIKIENAFENHFIDNLINVKNKIFGRFPYGQTDDLSKREDAKATSSGDYPIKNLLELDPIFKDISKSEIIKRFARKILGEGFAVTNMSMRKIPKGEHILDVHRDYCGGLSFSILLDNILEKEGETFFYKGSYKYPPPPYVNYKQDKFKNDIVSTTGKIGDIYFWFPDSWHGRNNNIGNDPTCILMCDIENKNSERKIYFVENNQENTNLQKSKSTINKLFKYIGNNPNSLAKHFFYCVFFFKFSKLKKMIDENKINFTRMSFGKQNIDNISLTKYLLKINLKKFIKVIVVNFIVLIIGRKNFKYFRNKIKTNA